MLSLAHLRLPRLARKLPWLFAAAGVVFGNVGCAAAPRPQVMSAPHDAPMPVASVPTVVVQPVPAPVPVRATTLPDGVAPLMIIVSSAPPQPPPEAIPAAPTPVHVWVAGYWTWCNDAYEWVRGRWTLPPTVRAQWVAPRWEREGNAYRFCPGFWN